MATEEGLVYKETQDTVWIKTQRAKTCEHCAAHDDCKTSGSKLSEMEVEVSNTVGAKLGDRVMLTMPTSSLLQLSFLMYVVPIITMIIGGIIGQKLAPYFQFDETNAAVISSIAFFLITLWIIRLFSNKLAKKNKYRPQIKRILKSGESIDQSCEV
ncbi:sigma-E factor negative regulatory protein RseC [Candidatus Magnetomoraceae bacterium gMMP-15]